MTWPLTIVNAGAAPITVFNAPAHGLTDPRPGPLTRTAAGAIRGAQGTTPVLAEVWYYLLGIIDANNLLVSKIDGVEVTLPAGDEAGAAFVANTGYFVSALAPWPGGAGRMTATRPATFGFVAKPIVLTTSATLADLHNMRADTIINPATYDRIGLSGDLSLVTLDDYGNMFDNPGMWGAAPPANVVDTTPVLVGSPNSRERAIRIPGVVDAVNPRIFGIFQAVPAGPFVATVKLSMRKAASWNASNVADTNAGLLWVDANGQNMHGVGFDLSIFRAVATPHTNANARFISWDGSGDANNDPTGIWTIGGAQVGYGEHRATFTIERDGADSLRHTVRTVRGGEEMVSDLADPSPGGDGFLVICGYQGAAATYAFDTYVESQILVGTELPWLVTP